LTKTLCLVADRLGAGILKRYRPVVKEDDVERRATIDVSNLSLIMQAGGDIEFTTQGGRTIHDDMDAFDAAFSYHNVVHAMRKIGRR
jgi:hypothetical protein